MDVNSVVHLGQQALTMILLLSAPVLILSLIVGLLVSIFQATTQIQEATLAFVPKIIVVFLSLVIFGHWMISTATNFTKNLFLNIDKFIK
ncbi:flagellar biosynthetic protein FliQ [Alkalithermobacter thermoalcaliphilus JW-YL-7 = DSM 7308]|uniref:Flagellar biosynthetic protein FliQ n=1 Tax=Alkalithermobacter thermoalcaliphilus JW-YL-7 = DSM 7308 TaxID=1121328 RepID=A0A150FQA2_CLOPD|nr:flagellar biosynthetic protein FliQ [[Clostridium] paradoxum JW-YL-7 = DSM 7308]SHK60767.1 flagellar biosynthetic protein FliQ [[Clostridium] paradoxum JW-YL-7 = DSM 7308]